MLENRSRTVEFVQSGLRVLAAFYICYRYPDVLAQKGVVPPEGFFVGDTLQGLLEFMTNVTVQGKKWD